MKPNRVSMMVKKERNDKLLADYLAGVPLKKLMEEYKISRARIYQIIARY